MGNFVTSKYERYGKCQLFGQDRAVRLEYFRTSYLSVNTLLFAGLTREMLPIFLPPDRSKMGGATILLSFSSKYHFSILSIYS